MELAQRIMRTIQEYQQERPGTQSGEIDQALRIALHQFGASRRRRVILLVLVTGILVALLFAVLFLQRFGSHG
jgi:hypothetical protein